MFDMFGGNKYQSTTLDGDQLRERYNFKAAKYLLYALTGLAVARGYGYLFSCHRVLFNPLFDAFWGLWAALLFVPIVMACVNKYAGHEIVQPWMVSMFMVLAIVAFVAVAFARLGARLCTGI